MEADGSDQAWVDDLRRDVAQQMQQAVPPLRIDLSKVATQSTPSTPSPRLITSTGNDMKALMAARLKEEQEQKAAKARARAKANATKQKVVKSSRSSESTTATSSEGEQRPALTKASGKAKEATLKVPAKAVPKPSSVAKPKCKRTLGEPVAAAMPPPQSVPSVAPVKRQASRTAQPSTTTANMSVTEGAPTPTEARIEQIGSLSESEASLPTASKPKKISMAKLAKVSLKMYPNRGIIC